jgi:hypothetical protein
MSKKREKLDQIMQIPVTKSLQKQIEAEAQAEERRTTDMARILWREALDARAAKDQESELATSNK